MPKKKNNAVMMNPTAKHRELISLEKMYSIDMRGVPITVDNYHERILLFNQQATDLANLAGLGFYRIGQLLLKAEDELGQNDYRKLSKLLAEDGLHPKAQQRYRRIANNKYINENWMRLPKAWTFWERLTSLITNATDEVDDERVKSIDHLINNDVKWSDIEEAMNLKSGKTKTSTAGQTITVSELNVKDNHNEIYGLEYDFIRGQKRHKASFDNFEKDLKELKKKYPFIKLKQSLDI